MNPLLFALALSLPGDTVFCPDTAVASSVLHLRVAGGATYYGVYIPSFQDSWGPLQWTRTGSDTVAVNMPQSGPWIGVSTWVEVRLGSRTPGKAEFVALPAPTATCRMVLVPRPETGTLTRFRASGVKLGGVPRYRVDGRVWK